MDDNADAIARLFPADSYTKERRSGASMMFDGQASYDEAQRWKKMTPEMADADGWEPASRYEQENVGKSDDGIVGGPGSIYMHPWSDIHPSDFERLDINHDDPQYRVGPGGTLYRRKKQARPR